MCPNHTNGTETDRRTERGQRRLLEHVDDDLIVERAREPESRPEAREDGK